MKGHQLVGEPLIGLAVAGEQGCHRRRYLVGAGGQQVGGGNRCGRICRAQRPADVCYVSRRSRYRLGEYRY